MWLFSCFKHDPSKVHVKTAIVISEYEEEDRIVRRKREEDEKIEIERVKEVSFKEEEEKRRIKESKQVNDNGQQTNHSKPHMDPLPSSSICNGCNSEFGHEESVNAFGLLWHPHCLCCLHCHKPLAIHEISNLKGQFHKPCYKKLHCPKCYVCNKKFPSTEEGREYKEHEFWKEKYCPCHDYDETAKCCSCERLESCRTKYIMLDDRRWLCRECVECAVMDTDEVQPLHIEIREFFESLGMKIDKEFHLFLVEKEALNKAEKEEKIVNQYGVFTRGICLSEEQIVTRVTEGPRMGPNQELIKDVVTESHRVFRKCEVTALLILYGFPRLVTGYLLAHEMMHAWLRINGYRNLDIVLEEGLCQVLGHMWLEPQAYATPETVATASSSRTLLAAATSKKGDQSDFEKRLVEFCKYQIETDDSPVYGLGFKKVNKMMVKNNHNLKDTLRDIVEASRTILDS